MGSVINLFKRKPLKFSDETCRHGDDCIYDYIYRYLSQILIEETDITIIVYHKTPEGLYMEFNNITIDTELIGCRFTHRKRDRIDLNVSLFGLKFYEAFKEQTRKIIEFVDESYINYQAIRDIYSDTNTRPTDRFWQNVRSLIYVSDICHVNRITERDAANISRISNLTNLSVILKPSRGGNGSINIDRISASVVSSIIKKPEQLHRMHA